MVFRMAARPALVGWSALGAMLASLIACGASDATQPPPTTEAPRACTQEAKVCPDGTVVSRTGPSCEFAACPRDAGAPPPPAELTPTTRP